MKQSAMGSCTLLQSCGRNNLSRFVENYNYFTQGKHYPKHLPIASYRKQFFTYHLSKRICATAIYSTIIHFTTALLIKLKVFSIKNDSICLNFMTFDAVFTLYLIEKMCWRVGRCIISEVTVETLPVKNIDSPSYMIALKSSSPLVKYISSRKLLQVSQSSIPFEVTPLVLFHEVKL